MARVAFSSVMAGTALLLIAGATFAEGGSHGPAITGNFLAARPAESAGAGAPRCVASRKMAHYVATEQEPEIASLFAPDGLWLSPTGAEWLGRDMIAAGLAKGKALAAARPPLAHVPFSVVGDGRDCFIELAIESAPGGSFRIASIIHVTEDGKGKITRAITYLRPRPPEPDGKAAPR